jgi:two-component system, OmpR family, phosphate regulon response regulator PhoB
MRTLPKVLIVEDEQAIAELIAVNLRHNGFQSHWVMDAETALLQVDQALPDVILLDWMLPSGSGLWLAKKWRSQERTQSVPILMLTARGEESERVAGLEAGCDDYVVKPFSPKELIARIRAVLRRRQPDLGEEELSVSQLTLNTQTHRVTWQGQVLRLGPTEFKLLHHLMRHPDRVHSRASLLDKVWGDHVFIEERTVDVHIKRLREALGAEAASLIETVRGVGYRFLRTG